MRRFISFAQLLVLALRYPGAFRLVTEKRGRTVQCNYHPMEPGVYVVDIRYDDVLLPGSPYQVYVARDTDDLRRFQAIHSEA